VEQDRALDRLIATGTALPGRSRPLCPDPTFAHHDGRGDANAAASFTCR